jgi:hypothetical protein
MKQRRTITTVSFLLLGLGLHAQEIVSATVIQLAKQHTTPTQTLMAR